jgi:FMN-dependent NADH-azoreductase
VTILHIDTSINGDNSASRQLTKSLVEQLRGSQWGEEVVYRDLAAKPIPHLTLDQFADPSVLDEFLAADTIVIGAPMYNFGIPSQLKAWFDRIAIAGKTFQYTKDGPQGLAGGRRVIIALARGGIYSAGSPTAEFEFVERYLRAAFNFIGIEPAFVVAEGLAISPELREQSIGQALGETLRLAA